jgi:PLP dependent protein
MTAVGRRLQAVRYRIAAACARSGRDPASVRLVAVTKTVPAEAVGEAFRAGQTLFGENRVQEALAKIPAVDSRARWHLIGHLQTNKARHAVGAFELIHSVDDIRLAKELDRRAASAGVVQAVLLQVNLAGEPTKSGAGEDALAELLKAVAALEHLDVRGLMTIPPPVDDPAVSRPWFVKLRALRDRAAEQLGRPLPELSMGMSDDFEVAVQEGATLVRVGTAIFGERDRPADP